MKRFVTGLLVVLLSAGVSPAQRAGEPELEAAKALYHDGRFTEAAARLEALCERLGRTGKPQRHELTDAYLYLGLSHVAVNDRPAAKAAFRELARLDQARRLDPEVYAPKVVELFEEARAEVGVAAPLPPPPRAAGTAAKKRGSKLPYVILGSVAGVGGGAALALGARKPSPPTQARLTIAPEGQAIAGITLMSFVATASAHGEATYVWNFGDGATASGANATHVYDRDGAFGVVLTVANKGGSASASGIVSVRSLTGLWRPDAFFAPCYSVRMTHSGSRVDAVAINGSSAVVTVTNPRQILLSISDAPAQNCVSLQNFSGTFDPALDSFTITAPGTSGRRDIWRRQ